MAIALVSMSLAKSKCLTREQINGLFVHRLGCSTVYAERTVRFCYRPQRQYRGMVAEVARKAHYLEVGGSNPSPTTLLEDTRGEQGKNTLM